MFTVKSDCPDCSLFAGDFFGQMTNKTLGSHSQKLFLFAADFYRISIKTDCEWCVNCQLRWIVDGYDILSAVIQCWVAFLNFLYLPLYFLEGWAPIWMGTNFATKFWLANKKFLKAHLTRFGDHFWITKNGVRKIDSDIQRPLSEIQLLDLWESGSKRPVAFWI